MKKNDVLMFGVLLQGDIFVDGYGTTKEDQELLKEGLSKVYNVNDSSPEEVKAKIEGIIDEDMKKLLVEYRSKMVKFLKSEETS